MRRIKLVRWLGVAVLAFASVACEQKSESNIEAVAFQETSDGMWGMITPEGKVLFSEEFKRMPTAVTCGRFFVKNKEGFWEMYTAEEKPQKVGGEYRSATKFVGGEALVSERGKPITLIDTDGKVLMTYEQVGSKPVTMMYPFNDGYAPFKAGGKWGLMSRDGKPVIAAKYYAMTAVHDGKVMAVPIEYEDEISKNSDPKIKVHILNVSGKLLLELSTEKYKDISDNFVDGLIAVAVERDGKRCWGIINDKGETVVKPSEKYTMINIVSKDCFIYNNGDGYGVADMEGKVLIRAKYDLMSSDGKGRFMAYTLKDKEHYTYSMKYIDLEGNAIGDETYQSGEGFSLFGGKNTFVNESENSWIIINDKGEELKHLPDMVAVNTGTGDYVIESDYVDIEGLVKSMKISKDGISDFKLSTPAIEAVNISAQKNEHEWYDKEHAQNDPYWYDYKNHTEYTVTVCEVPVEVSVLYPENISHKTYREETVIDYVGYYNTYYHIENIPTGYAFTNESPIAVSAKVERYGGAMRGKIRSLFKSVSAKLKTLGSVEQENDAAIVVKLGGSKKGIAFIENNAVTVTISNGDNVGALDIDTYKGNKEELEEE